MLAVLLFPVPTLRFMCQEISEDSIKKNKKNSVCVRKEGKLRFVNWQS